MTNQAQRPDVTKIALAAAFDDSNNVIGIPQAASIHRLQTPAR